MAQKNATPTREQKEAIKRAGLDPANWVVLHDLRHSMIIRYRITGEGKIISKEKAASGGNDTESGKGESD